MVTTVVVSNPSEEIKAVEVNMSKRAYMLDRTEVLTDTEDFIVIPSQFILGPKQDRAVTLKWIGSTKIKKELPFRLVVEEVEFKDKEKSNTEGTTAKVSIRLRFVNSFYIKPKSIKPHVVAEEIIPTGDKGFLVTLDNQGSEHLIINEFKLNVVDEKNVHISTVDVSPTVMAGSINLLAGEKQQILLPPIDGLTRRPYQVRLVSMNQK